MTEEELAYMIQNFYISLNSWMKSKFKNQLNSQSNLTLPQFKVLYIINEQKICNMSHLSEMMEVNKGTMTTMLNKLVKDGVVKRSNSIRDRRTIFVELTEKGVEAVSQMQVYLLTSLVGVTENLENEQQEEIHSALLKLNNLFKKK